MQDRRNPTGQELGEAWANLVCIVAGIAALALLAAPGGTGGGVIGAGRAERRLHFRPPVMVRADRFAGVPAATAATYRLPAETGVAG